MRVKGQLRAPWSDSVNTSGSGPSSWAVPSPWWTSQSTTTKRSAPRGAQRARAPRDVVEQAVAAGEVASGVVGASAEVHRDAARERRGGRQRRARDERRPRSTSAPTRAGRARAAPARSARRCGCGRPGGVLHGAQVRPGDGLGWWISSGWRGRRRRRARAAARTSASGNGGPGSGKVARRGPDVHRGAGMMRRRDAPRRGALRQRRPAARHRAAWTRAEEALFARHGVDVHDGPQARPDRLARRPSRRSSSRRCSGARAQALMEELHDARDGRGRRRRRADARRGRAARRAARGGHAGRRWSRTPRATSSSARCAAAGSPTLRGDRAGDEVAQPKPAPDIYLAAAAALGADPASCAALEDSPTGVAGGAGRRACS